LIAFPLQGFTAIEHCFVLDSTGEDVIALLSVSFGYALDREVIRLGGAAGENNFPWGCRTDQRCDLFPRPIDCRFTVPTKNMIATRSVAELLCEERQHRFHYPGIDLGGGVIVHVNRQFHTKLGRETQLIPLDWSDLKITNLVPPVNE
jgi:hypothetical protein